LLLGAAAMVKSAWRAGTFGTGRAVHEFSRFPCSRKEKAVIRIVDRLLERIVPKATASACSGTYVCLSGILFWRYCCPQSGCEYSYVRTGC
jgi:hypothetical protein